ncbi:MAG: hypothetical protein RMX26_06070, partial [Planktomarina sp.]|nr:hypothetical protein [Planktomarina sp.]
LYHSGDLGAVSKDRPTPLLASIKKTFVHKRVVFLPNAKLFLLAKISVSLGFFPAYYRLIKV